MFKVFGKKLCTACQEMNAELDAQDVDYTYFDIDTAEGLAEAAYHGILGKKIALPVIIPVADVQEKENNPAKG